MDGDVIRIAVGLRLGLPLCRPHECSNCGAQIEEFGTHGLSCRFSRGRHSRHASLNDIIKRSLDTAKIPSHLEPSIAFFLHLYFVSPLFWIHGMLAYFIATSVSMHYAKLLFFKYSFGMYLMFLIHHSNSINNY